MKRSFLTACASALLFVSASHAADYLDANERTKGRSYSPAVITDGGRVVWLAGETAVTDANGKDIRGDFEAQTRAAFAQIDETLKRAGGSLQDVVSITTYLTDARNGAIFSKVRGEMFPSKNYPASAQITVSALAVPGMQIEIHAVAVIGDKCSKPTPCVSR